MREYIFRGKCGNKWHYGDLCTQSNTPQIIAYNKKYDKMDTAFVDPETVGQYTGLTDKNGVKIFEGDILRRAYHPNDDYIVEWNDGRFSFRKRIYPREYGYEHLVCCQHAVSILKVIGNIHDNPDLLKEGGK